MKIVVYCSSKEEIDRVYKDDAAFMGCRIGASGADLVYGGIGKGLMSIVASNVLSAGGKVIGVVPASRREWAYEHNTETITACDLNDRKSRMMALGDAFVVLSGGYGTLDELISTFAYLTFTGDTCKKIVMINRDGLFDHVLDQLRLMASKGLMDAEIIERINIACDAEECCRILGI